MLGRVVTPGVAAVPLQGPRNPLTGDHSYEARETLTACRIPLAEEPSISLNEVNDDPLGEIVHMIPVIPATQQRLLTDAATYLRLDRLENAANNYIHCHAISAKRSRNYLSINQPTLKLYSIHDSPPARLRRLTLPRGLVAAP